MVGFWWFLLLLNECPFFSPDLLILFLVLLGLGCCTSFSRVAVCGLIVVALTVKQGVWGCSSCGSWALGHSLRSCGAGLSCSMGSFQIGGGTRLPCIGRWILYHRATREAPSVLLWQVDPLPLSHQGSPKCPSLT